MPNPFQTTWPPFSPPGDTVYFHDWRYVSGGHFAWESAVDGKAIGIWHESAEPVPPMRFRPHDLGDGLEIVALPATKTDPIIHPPDEHSIILTGGTVVHDGGRYRLWYEVWPTEQYGTPQMGHRNYFYHAESDDGFTWRFPKQNRIERHGSTGNHAVIGPSIQLEYGMHGASVFLDPSAPAAERYKLVCLGQLTEEMVERLRAARPDQIPPAHKGRSWGLCGATSPDGLHWTFIPEPLSGQMTDTQNIGEYDEALGQYVVHCRSWYYGRRTIARAAGPDFRALPIGQQLLWPSATVRCDQLWYANGKNRMPGIAGPMQYHVMFPLQWSLDEDRFDCRLMTSPDNMTWGFVTGEGNKPELSPGNPGSWDGGVVWIGCGMVNLPGERMGVLFQGSPVPHKHPRKPPLGKLAWATWKRGRLTALRAKREVTFALQTLKVAGRTARANFKVHHPAGFVQFEAVDLTKGHPLPGRSFDDCDHLTGDQLDATVTWKGQSDLGHAADQNVQLRVRMRSADLFAVSFH